jgi:hypothetical protein
MTECPSPAPHIRSALMFAAPDRDRSAISRGQLTFALLAKLAPFMAEIVEHLGNAAHPHAANADEMDGPDVARRFHGQPPSGDALRFRCSAGHARREALGLAHHLRFDPQTAMRPDRAHLVAGRVVALHWRNCPVADAPEGCGDRAGRPGCFVESEEPSAWLRSSRQARCQNTYPAP